MLRMKSALFVFFFLLSTLEGVILETAHFSELPQYVQGQTLVVLDVDETLLIPTQTLGGDAWFCYRVKQHEKGGLLPKEAFERALADWQAVRHMTKIKMVEEGTDKIIQNLQKQGVVVMGLTTQGLALANRTIQHLRSIGIDLGLTPPSHEEHYFINKLGVLFRQGLLFTAGTPKGPALLTLLDRSNFKPARIVFINDKEAHLKDVESAVLARNIDFIGLRYSYCDEVTAGFDSTIADIQWNQSTFSHILSDEEAAKLR